jgi:hypothetical protein
LSTFATLNYLFLINLLIRFLNTNRLSIENRQKINSKIRIFRIPKILMNPVKSAAIPKLIKIRL